MKLSYEDHDAISVLTLSGSLTSDQADAFRRACRDRFEHGIRDVVLDVQYLETVDSAGLELLLWLLDEVSGRAGQLRLVRPDDVVLKILEITRLAQRFSIHGSIEAAAKSLH
jgi:anti-anti-sigma factor